MNVRVAERAGWGGVEKEVFYPLLYCTSDGTSLGDQAEAGVAGAQTLKPFPLLFLGRYQGVGSKADMNWHGYQQQVAVLTAKPQ